MIVEVIKLEQLHDTKKIYKEVALYLYKKNYIKSDKTFYEEMIDRENQGVIKVYDDLYLPHIISENMNINIVLKLDGQYDNFLFLLLNSYDSKYKNKAIKIVEFLLDRNNVDVLFSLDKTAFTEKINSI